MRVLHTVEFYSPSVGGMQEAVRQISERLVQMGHCVDVATSFHPDRKKETLNGVRVRQFNVRGKSALGMDGETEEYERFLLESNYDLVANFAAQQWTTDIALPILHRIKGKKVFVPTGYSGLRDPAFHGYFESLKDWIKNYDACIYLSKDYRDFEWGRQVGAPTPVVIPNGAAADEFDRPVSLDIRARLGIPKGAFLVLLVGSHSGAKGHVEAIEIFKRAGLRDATLLIVGNDPTSGCGPRCLRRSRRFNLNVRHRLKSSKALVKELTREETVAAYHSADLFLFPSQIECSPLVIFEAMASKTPFLATAVGNIGELALFGGGILMNGEADDKGYIHADIEDGAQKLRNLRDSAERRIEMAEQGHNAWQKNFTWEIVAGQYDHLYRHLAPAPA